MFPHCNFSDRNKKKTWENKQTRDFRFLVQSSSLNSGKNGGLCEKSFVCQSVASNLFTLPFFWCTVELHVQPACCSSFSSIAVVLHCAMFRRYRFIDFLFSFRFDLESRRLSSRNPCIGLIVSTVFVEPWLRAENLAPCSTCAITLHEFYARLLKCGWERR